MCNQFSLENRALLHKILPNPSMANFTTRILLRSQNFQNTTLPISAQCALERNHLPALNVTSVLQALRNSRNIDESYVHKWSIFHAKMTARAHCPDAVL